jgi:phospholipid/cholesterol/gamma-HCH transport system permease protein
MPRTSTLERWVGGFGGQFTGGLGSFGRFWVFAGYAISFIPLELVSRRGWGRFLPQCFYIGTRSVPVLMLTGAFVGMVLVVQGWSQFDAAGLGDYLGAIVNVGVVSELGPVLAGIMLAGRVGGALTAELGTMNVTEQLLALRSMGADPVRYLVTPRFLACLVLTPILTIYADLLGAFGSWLVYTAVYQGESAPYWRHTQETIEMWDLSTGLVKALFFGGAIGMISCYKGFHCKAGAQGVGQACTQAFVISFIAILALDLFLNMAINGLYAVWFGFRPLVEL